MNSSKYLRRASAVLSSAGIDSARVDAELLAAHVLGVERGKLLLVDTFTDEQIQLLDGLVARRAQRVPLQHLTGTAPFLGLTLRVGPGVFIPRPETELLAQWGLSVLAPNGTVVDLCSGSGALALAVASGRPDATVYAVELSPAAIPWLRENVAGTQVQVIEGDIREVAIPGPVDLVLCNPPYVPLSTQAPPEVRHDPAEAVFAGADGLELIPAVISRAAGLLKAGGRLGLEHDDSHTGLATLLEADFVDIQGHLDLAGRPRYTTAVRGL